MESHINERGNKVRTESCERQRFEVDNFCKPELGWGRYRTAKDGPRFGAWVNLEAKKVALLCDGTFSFIECDSDKGLSDELLYVADFYGESKLPWQSLGGKFDLMSYVKFGGKQGVVRDKTFDSDLGWVFKVCFDDSEEWLEEKDLELVWR